MKWFSVEWSTREFEEQKKVELIFCASDEIREKLSELLDLGVNQIMIHTITHYHVTTIQGGFC
jgi:hypothetical protein